MSIPEQLHKLNQSKVILDSHCLETDAGIESIDPGVFLSTLHKMTHRSRQALAALLKEQPEEVGYHMRNEYALTRQVTAVPYARVDKNILFKPVGFTGKFSDFLNLLNSHKVSVVGIRDQLTLANKAIGEYITNPEDLQKFDGRTLPKIKKDTFKDFGAFFNAKSGIDQDSMENLYSSYNDFNRCSDEIELLTRTFKGANAEIIKQQVDDFYSSLEILERTLTSEGVVIPKRTAKYLGSVIYGLAEWVSLYSLYITKLVSLNKAHMDNVKKLNSLV